MDEPIPLTDFSIELRDDHLVKCRGSATFHCPHSDGAHLVGKQCPMSNMLWNFVRETFLVKSYHKKKPVTKLALKKFKKPFCSVEKKSTYPRTAQGVENSNIVKKNYVTMPHISFIFYHHFALSWILYFAILFFSFFFLLYFSSFVS